MIDSEMLHVGLRALVYIGTVAAAGAQLVAWTLPGIAERSDNALNQQRRIGLALLLVIEPLRLIFFQLAMAGGSLEIATSQAFLSMGLEMSSQQASLLRLVTAAALVCCVSCRAKNAAVVVAGVMVASYLLEGHTASKHDRIFYAIVLFVHLAAAHWWLGALYPLSNASRVSSRSQFGELIDSFSKVAIVTVPVLIVAGAALLLSLVDWKIDFENAYQQRFLVKIGLVAALLALAVRNKFWLTPLLNETSVDGNYLMRRSIQYEILVALALLVITAWVLRTGPDHNHVTVSKSTISLVNYRG